MQDVAPGTMCLNCISYGDILEESYLEQLEAAPNHHLEPTNDDPQDDVESTKSSSNRSFDANWDATVYANAYASENDSEDNSDSLSDLSSDGASDSSNSSSNSSFSDDNSDSSSDSSDDDDSELTSDESSISLEGEIALNVDQDAFCMINPNSDEVSEDENTENGNDNNFYSIIKYVLEGAITTFYSENFALWTFNDVTAKTLWKYPKGVFTAFEGSF